MKYIRTKDRVCEFEMNLETMPSLVAVKGEGISGFILKEDIIKQADTIEELCDDFIGVLDNGNGSHIWYDDEYLGITEWETPEELSTLKFKYAKANLCLNEILYGAIWTNKGLIYVAKLNDKGELELL